MTLSIVVNSPPPSGTANIDYCDENENDDDDNNNAHTNDINNNSNNDDDQRLFLRLCLLEENGFLTWCTMYSDNVNYSSDETNAPSAVVQYFQATFWVALQTAYQQQLLPPLYVVQALVVCLGFLAALFSSFVLDGIKSLLLHLGISDKQSRWVSAVLYIVFLVILFPVATYRGSIAWRWYVFRRTATAFAQDYNDNHSHGNGMAFAPSAVTCQVEGDTLPWYSLAIYESTAFVIQSSSGGSGSTGIGVPHNDQDNTNRITNPETAPDLGISVNGRQREGGGGGPSSFSEQRAVRIPLATPWSWFSCILVPMYGRTCSVSDGNSVLATTAAASPTTARTTNAAARTTRSPTTTSNASIPVEIGIFLLKTHHLLKHIHEEEKGEDWPWYWRLFRFVITISEVGIGLWIVELTVNSTIVNPYIIAPWIVLVILAFFHGPLQRTFIDHPHIYQELQSRAQRQSPQHQSRNRNNNSDFVSVQRVEHASLSELRSMVLPSCPGWTVRLGRDYQKWGCLGGCTVPVYFLELFPATMRQDTPN